MAFRGPSRLGGGAGAGGFVFGTSPSEFTGATLAACRTARDNQAADTEENSLGNWWYSTDQGNPGTLELFSGNFLLNKYGLGPLGASLGTFSKIASGSTTPAAGELRFEYSIGASKPTKVRFAPGEKPSAETGRVARIQKDASNYVEFIIDNATIETNNWRIDDYYATGTIADDDDVTVYVYRQVEHLLPVAVGQTQRVKKDASNYYDYVITSIDDNGSHWSIHGTRTTVGSISHGDHVSLHKIVPSVWLAAYDANETFAIKLTPDTVDDDNPITYETRREAAWIVIAGTIVATEGDDGAAIWTGTQTQYDAISSKDANTAYFITS